MEIINKYITVNYTSGRGGKVPNRITCHTCVCSASSLYTWFNNPQAQASTNFYINSSGQVERYVRDTDTAWGNSNWESNQRSFSFETWDNKNPGDPVRTDAMYEGAAQLVAYLCTKYSIPCRLVPRDQAQNWNYAGIDLHNYFNSGKSCPAALNVQRIIDRANLIINQNLMDPQIAHDGSNLLGYKMSDEMVVAETKNLKNVFGGSYGKWYETFRNNKQCLDFNVDTLNTQIQTLTAANMELQKLVKEQEDTIARQAQTISDLGVEIANYKAEIEELNKRIDSEVEKNKKLTEELAACQAGSQEPDIVIRIWIRIKQLFKRA